jgi:chromosome partitioning protein
VYDALTSDFSVQDAICATELDTLEALPANRELTGATIELMDLPDREYRLRQVLHPIRDNYDFLVIDCPPSLGILTLNALVAADSLLIPIQCEYYALEGLSDLLATLSRVRQSLNPKIRIEGVLLTMYDDRLNLSGQISENVRDHLGSHVLATIIPRNVRLAEAPSFGKPILLYDARSRGANSYLQLAREILSRMSVVKPAGRPAAEFGGS